MKPEAPLPHLNGEVVCMRMSSVVFSFALLRSHAEGW